MAKAKSDGGKVQIVFLVDVFSKRHFVKQEDLEEVSELRCRAISLCVLRLLLHFNAPVEHSTRTKPLTWGFKFFNSRILSIEYKRRKFYNLDSDSFRRFEKEMEERFASVCSQNETESKQTCSGAKALSCSFTEILHDFSWTTPDISSPFRNGKGAHLKDGLKRPKNFLFVLGDCPLGNSDLQFYFGRKEVFNEDVLMKEVFSPALYEEFRSTCDLSLFWIDVGLWCLAPEKLDVIIKV